jgi:hypothetical protein
MTLFFCSLTLVHYKNTYFWVVSIPFHTPPPFITTVPPRQVESFHCHPANVQCMCGCLCVVAIFNFSWHHCIDKLRIKYPLSCHQNLSSGSSKFSYLKRKYSICDSIQCIFRYKNTRNAKAWLHADQIWYKLWHCLVIVFLDELFLAYGCTFFRTMKKSDMMQRN